MRAMIRSTVEWTALLLAVTLPLSIKLYLPEHDLEVIFPAEPLIALLALIILLRFAVERKQPPIDLSFIRHPISILIACYLVMSGVSALASTMPMVSFKALVVRCSYAAVFFFIHALHDRRDHLPERMLSHFRFSFLFVAAFAMVVGAIGGDGRGSAGHAAFPFFQDHTIHAAVLVYVLIWSIWQPFIGSTPDAVRTYHARDLILVGALILALFLSYCRAAWISAVAALGVFLFLRIPARHRTLVAACCMMLLVTTAVVMRSAGVSARTTVDSNADGAGWKESVLSLANATTDASNKERINRWKCGWRMFRERPLFGFGPGTYQFKYHRHQRPEEMTYLSIASEATTPYVTRAFTFSERLLVRAPMQIVEDRGGTAHSEYFLALSESGGMVAFALIAIMALACWRACRTLDADPTNQTANLLWPALLGLVAYAVHAVFNNFLDDARVAFLFFSCLALVVRADRPSAHAVVK